MLLFINIFKIKCTVYKDRCTCAQVACTGEKKVPDKFRSFDNKLAAQDVPTCRQILQVYVPRTMPWQSLLAKPAPNATMGPEVGAASGEGLSTMCTLVYTHS
jgi:hypothetical protein